MNLSIPFYEVFENFYLRNFWDFLYSFNRIWFHSEINLVYSFGGAETSEYFIIPSS